MRAVVELAIHSSLLRLPDEQAEGHLWFWSTCSSSSSIGDLDFQGNLKIVSKI